MRRGSEWRLGVRVSRCLTMLAGCIVACGSEAPVGPESGSEGAAEPGDIAPRAGRVSATPDNARLASVGPSKSARVDAVLGSALPATSDSGVPRGMMVKRGPESSAIVTAANTLKYYGGPVVQNPKVWAVQWGNGVDVTVASNIGTFYSDVLQSSYLDWLSEYNTAGLAAPTTNQGIARGSYAGSRKITPSAGACPTAPCTLDDTKLQSELVAQINAGNLPPPTLGCDGNTDTIYMIDFPAGITITEGGHASCVYFCAYHGATTPTVDVSGTPVHVLYGSHPYMGSGSACVGGCGSGTYLQNVTMVHSHELIEAVTDAQVSLASTFGPPLAWYNNANGEIGDICNGQIGTLLGGSGTTWTVQKEWSNRSNACITNESATPPCTAANTPAGCRVCTCADNNINCSGGTPVCETDAGNVKNGYCVQCTNDTQCTLPQTCQKTSTASDDTCTACVPLTSCPGLANCGSIPDGCGGTVNCGSSCVAPQTCGGGGTPNVCGCTPLGCTLGQCGTIPNGCGGLLDCGTCTLPQSCGGGGTPNLCGCTPLSCSPGQCGNVDNGCGSTMDCGACTPPQSCGGGGTPNQCGCTPLSCSPAQCGNVDNGCGGTMDCGVCGPDAGSDAGSDASGGSDGSTPDSSTPDSSTPDSSTPDSSTPDSSTPDASTTDASTADGSTPDASTSDAASTTDASTSSSSGGSSSGGSSSGGSSSGGSSSGGGSSSSGGASSSGSSGATADDAGTTPPPNDPSGCSCRTAETKTGSSPLAAYGALALVGLLRQRRRRR